MTADRPGSAAWVLLEAAALPLPHSGAELPLPHRSVQVHHRDTSGYPRGTTGRFPFVTIVSVHLFLNSSRADFNVELGQSRWPARRFVPSWHAVPTPFPSAPPSEPTEWRWQQPFLLVLHPAAQG